MQEEIETVAQGVVKDVINGIEEKLNKSCDTKCQSKCKQQRSLLCVFFSPSMYFSYCCSLDLNQYVEKSPFNCASLCRILFLIPTEIFQRRSMSVFYFCSRFFISVNLKINLNKNATKRIIRKHISYLFNNAIVNETRK